MENKFSRLIALINSPKSKFVIITFVVSAIGFFKSFLLLKIFDFEKLGIIALSQTVTTTISLLQIGAVTGAYRLFSYKRENILKRVNAALLMFFIMLTILLCIVGCVVDFFYNTGISSSVLFLLIIIGVTSLYSNWVTCKLLGTKNIFILNKAQLSSAIISFIITFFAKWLGLPAVLAGLLIQPLIIIGFAYLIVPSLIPEVNFLSFKKYIVKIISLGFVPYLTTGLTLFNSQLGRWVITFSLGTAILGKTFLVTLFVALVSVFPGAVSNLFFPSIIEKYELNLKDDLKATLKRQYLILGGYYLLVMLATILLANTMVRLFLPKHLESVYLIYTIFPSLLFLHLSGPAITFFNAAKKFRLILFGSLISVFTYVGLLSLYVIFEKPSLGGFFIIESISAFFFFIFNSYYFNHLNKS